MQHNSPECARLQQRETTYIADSYHSLSLVCLLRAARRLIFYYTTKECTLVLAVGD